MTKAQKIIKYFAVSLAILLIVSIFSTIIGIISNIFGLSFTKESNEYKIVEVNNNIDYIDIEINASKLTFIQDSSFKIEYNNDNINVKESNNKLIVKERNTLFRNNDINDELIVYIPSNKYFDNVSIEAGTGNIEIDSLNTKKLDFDLGAGSININSINVSSEASIDAGAGQLTIDNGNINNLDLDMGLGKVVINTKLNGNNDIDAGVGELEINLSDSIDNYNFNIDKGIGDIKINNESVSNHYKSGIGSNKIEIDGGIGSITINSLS